jgi:hypothetical protein
VDLAEETQIEQLLHPGRLFERRRNFRLSYVCGIYNIELYSIPNYEWESPS